MNFRIHAILESNPEPWFEDARVKTCAVILQRCAMRSLKQEVEARLAGIAEKSNHLARGRTSDERKAADLGGLLHHWMLHGKPTRVAQQVELNREAMDQTA